MPVIHLLVMLLPGLASSVSTEQVFESKTACEAARNVLIASSADFDYQCIPAPNATPNR